MAEWTVEIPFEITVQELCALPADMRARFQRIVELIETHGLLQVGFPHIRPLGSKLWEMRMTGRDGISRAIYVTAKGNRVLVVRVFVKKTQQTPKNEIELALKRVKELKL